jgi:hypothetical protein
VKHVFLDHVSDTDNPITSDAFSCRWIPEWVGPEYQSQQITRHHVSRSEERFPFAWSIVPADVPEICACDEMSSEAQHAGVYASKMGGILGAPLMDKLQQQVEDSFCTLNSVIVAQKLLNCVQKCCVAAIQPVKDQRKQFRVQKS